MIWKRDLQVVLRVVLCDTTNLNQPLPKGGLNVQLTFLEWIILLYACLIKYTPMYGLLIQVLQHHPNMCYPLESIKLIRDLTNSTPIPSTRLVVGGFLEPLAL